MPTAVSRVATAHPAGLQVGGAADRDEAEEHEDEEFAEPEIAVRPLAAGVVPRGQDARCADGQQPPVAGHDHHDQAGDGGQPEADERGALHRGRLGQAGADQSQRADPDRVGAADAVGVVVGVVDAHLQGHADHQGQGGDRQREPALEEGQAAGRDHRGQGGGQGSRPGAGQPLARRRPSAGLRAHGVTRAPRSFMIKSRMAIRSGLPLDSLGNCPSRVRVAGQRVRRHLAPEMIMQFLERARRGAGGGRSWYPNRDPAVPTTKPSPPRVAAHRSTWRSTSARSTLRPPVITTWSSRPSTTSRSPCHRPRSSVRSQPSLRVLAVSSGCSR